MLTPNESLLIMS